MLWVYAGLDLAACDRLARSSLPSGYIDVSKTRTAELAETMTTIYTHHPGCSMYLGFLDPLQMLSPPHEAACRRVFRECTVAFTTSNPFLLPYAWKNGTAKLKYDDKEIELEGDAVYWLNADWGVKFGSIRKGNQMAYDRIELLKKGMVVEYIKK
jgi:hypothetical protein